MSTDDFVKNIQTAFNNEAVLATLTSKITQPLHDNIAALHQQIILANNNVVALQATIQGQNDVIKSNQNFIQAQQVTIDDLCTRLANLELSNDALEQYSRRHNILISGIGETQNESEQDCATKVVRKINELLNIDDIKVDDFDRSHRARRSRNGKPRPILVKVNNYHTKQRLMNLTKILRQKQDAVPRPDQIYFNEDLTIHRQGLEKYASDLKRDKLVREYHNRDGKIGVKLHDGTKIKITKYDDFTAVPNYGPWSAARDRNRQHQAQGTPPTGGTVDNQQRRQSPGASF